MEKTSIRTKAEIKMKNPILVEGLPGIGLVGKIAIDHLIKTNGAKKIANIYHPQFPPQVLMRKNGIMRLLAMRMYHLPAKKNDLLLLAGDVQVQTPEAHFEITDKILDYFQKHGGKQIITLGGYGTGKHSKNPVVYGATTHADLVKKYQQMGIEFGKTRGSIVGAAGLLLGLGKLRKMQGVCLMGETHGGFIDPKSALVLINKLSEVLEIDIDTQELQKKVKEGEKFIKKLEEQSAKATGEASAGMARNVDELTSYIR